MPTSIDILSFLLAFTVLFFVNHLLSTLRRQDVFKERLQELMHYKERLLQGEEAPHAKAYQSAEEEEALPWLRKLINKIQSRGVEEQDNLKLLFDKAGIRSHNASFIYGMSKMGVMFLFILISGGVVLYINELNVFMKIAIVTLAAIVGLYVIDIILRYLVNARQGRIRKAFPEALDLMVICTEAGLSLTATIQRVAREISQISPDLGYELALLSIEMNMFSDQRKALQNFSNRLDSPYFKSIITNIIQAQQYGTPIAQTMRVISEQFRLDRLVEAEERAAKLPVLMSLPMMGLIFPCIYIVIPGPALIKVLANL